MRSFAYITVTSAGFNAVAAPSFVIPAPSFVIPAPSFVIPAKAGTQAHNHTRWMPTCAGMTNAGNAMIISK